MTRSLEELLDVDKRAIWHPYSALDSDLPVYPVVSASGVRLKLADGRELIDGMSSWWCAIHGYNHPDMNAALAAQMSDMAHVMFGGLTHAPAMRLTERLLTLVPSSLDAVFYSDSGSVSVEVAMKMAIQYWYAQGKPERKRFISLEHAYHGDTFGAMSVCDPVTGMHGLFTGTLQEQIFIHRPGKRFGDVCTDEDLRPLEEALEKHADEVAALIMEPIVQGAGGMWFYSADYLGKARELCNHYDVLLILDEIATGFGRTGKLFALEHAGIAPDILCVGKALTGGYLSLAATLASTRVHEVIDRGEPGVFMHGPTFMANPLACTAALTSLDLLLESPWQDNVHIIEQGLLEGLSPCRSLETVHDVRVLGAIGVVEMKAPVDMHAIVPALVDAGVWVRPFGRLVYLMPPYIMSPEDLQTLTRAVVQVLSAGK
ncbi:MAG: adenosylmethionine--8-amino-7-oxononanoate transaminase [Gammaproteobacteria bacterium]|nr:adenosylmethionine--8-amino-7-oxononanoate transaminase [Gammaproteobacteria bacterium]